MSGFGSFSQDAYEQLKEAYAKQMLLADEVENAGVKIGQDTLGVETAPIKSIWLDKTGLWKYPDGKGEYADTEQKQQDLLAALRNEEGEVELPEAEQELDLDSLSDEELDSMIDEILNEIEGEGGGEEESEGEEEPLSEEELNTLIDEILAEDDKDEEPQLSAADISARIAELKAELASLSEQVEEEEEEEEYEPEETQGTEEETDSEDEPVEEEEVASDDEPA